LTISAARVPSFHDSHGSRTCFFHVGAIARKPAQAGIGIGDGSGNRLIHLVRQGSGQFSHGGHPADACQFRLRLAPRFFRMLALKALCCNAWLLF